jgi:iron(III) transport system substrate-binding protein
MGARNGNAFENETGGPEMKKNTLTLTTAAIAAALIGLSGGAAAAQSIGKGNAEWAKIVKAAEGKPLNMMVMTGTAYATVAEAFQKAYPKIKVAITQARPGDSTARIVTEQKNGQFHWDIFWGPNNSVNAVLLPANGVQDMRPYFVLPEVKDDKNWMGGFDIYAQDRTKRTFTFLAAMNYRTGGFAVNYDMVPRDAVKDWNDLLDPKWQGKIVIYHPTRPITGAIALSCALPIVGEEYIKKLLTTQKLVPINDARLITDWIVRGRYPIVIGLSSTYLPKYRKQGLAKNIKEAGSTVCSGAGGPGINVLRNSPNGDTTKVFLNWFLSKEGQEVYTKAFWKFDQTFSRRTDVAMPEGPEVKETLDAFKRGKWVATGTESHGELMKQVLAITRKFYK